VSVADGNPGKDAYPKMFDMVLWEKMVFFAGGFNSRTVKAKGYTSAFMADFMHLLGRKLLELSSYELSGNWRKLWRYWVNILTD
jgi:hypothetical protein